MSEVINFRVDKKLKIEAQAIVKKMGISMSDALNIFLRKLVRDKAIDLNLEEPSAYFLKSLAQAKSDLANGDVSPAFDNVEDSIKWLHDKNRKYANQIQ